MNAKTRDALLRSLYDRRHELLDRERADGTLGEVHAASLKQIETRINELELEEYEEKTGPFRREQNVRLRMLADKLRPLVPADAMVPVDEAVARLETSDAAGSALASPAGGEGK